ncbi:trichohyalin-like [Macrobrachium rosenbergii]|uniref:trichohyalin-like n=1 Tax=Macrobrachium rosenbergii TaxID=79674 RepID=UPI0034D691B9
MVVFIMNSCNMKCVRFVNSVLARIPQVGPVDFSIITSVLQPRSVASVLKWNWFAGLLVALGGSFYYKFRQEEKARRHAEKDNLTLLRHMDNLRDICDDWKKTAEEARQKNRDLLDDIDNKAKVEAALQQRVTKLEKALNDEKLRHVEEVMDLEEEANNRIQMTEEKNKALKKIIEKNQALISRQRRELDDLNGLLTSKDLERERLRNDLAAVGREKEDLLTILQEREEFIRELSERLFQMTEERDQLEREIEDLIEFQEEMFEPFSLIHMANAVLREMNERAFKESFLREAALRKVIAHLEEELSTKEKTYNQALEERDEEFQRKLEKAHTYVEELESANEKLKHANEENEASIVKRQNEIDELNGLVTKQGLELNKGRLDMQEMKKRENGLENERSSLQKRLTEQEAEAKILKEESWKGNERVNELEARNEELENQLAAFGHEKEDLLRSLQGQEEIKKELSEEKERLRGEMKKEQSLKEALREELEKAKQVNRDLAEEMDDAEASFQKRTGELEDELRQKEKENAQHRRHIESLENEKKSVAEESEQRENELRDAHDLLRGKLEEASVRNQDLLQEIAQKDNNEVALLQRIEDTEEEKRKLESERKIFTLAYEDLERRIQDLERRNKDLEKRNEDLGKRNEDLEKRNEDLEKRNEDLEKRNEDLDRTNAKEDAIIRKQRQVIKDVYAHMGNDEGGDDRHDRRRPGTRRRKPIKNCMAMVKSLPEDSSGASRDVPADEEVESGRDDPDASH